MKRRRDGPLFGNGPIGRVATLACPDDERDPFLLQIVFRRGANPQATFPGTVPGNRQGVHLDPTLFDTGFIEPGSLLEAEMPYPTEDFPGAMRWDTYLHELGHRHPKLKLTDPINKLNKNPFGTNLLLDNTCREQMNMRPRRTYNGYAPEYMDDFWVIDANSPSVLFLGKDLGGPQDPLYKSRKDANNEYSRLRKALGY